MAYLGSIVPYLPRAPMIFAIGIGWHGSAFVSVSLRVGFCKLVLSVGFVTLLSRGKPTDPKALN